MAKSLKERTITGMIWSSVHRFGTMGLAFVTNIILARLLTPEDFGIIGMIMVFIAVSNAFVDGGFASALIQKKRPTDEDYSTIFYWNLGVSILLFSGLYYAAPAIERFYEMSSLAPILRVLGVVLILNAFNIIQFNQLRKDLNFKKLANIYVITNLLGAILAIYMAYTGFGVWSLVAKLMATPFTQTILLWFTSNWRPSLVFSIPSFKELFGFSSFMLLTSLLNKVYDNAQSLIIGKLFSAVDLGFYTQAKRMEEVPVKGLSSIVNQVTFPVFSELQDSPEKLRSGLSKTLKVITYINFPVMVFVIVAAEPIIMLILSSKWSESIPYLQILAMSGMLYTLTTVNTNIFKSLGRSDTYFWVTLVKRLFGITLIFIGAQFGIKEMLYAIVINTYLFFILNAYYSSNLTNYTIIDQVRAVTPAYVISIISGVLTYIISFKIDEQALVVILILQVLIYFFIYWSLSSIFKLESYHILKNTILRKHK